MNTFDFSQVLGNLAIMFSLILLGRKLRFSKETSNDMARLIVNVTFPLFIFNNFTGQFSLDILKTGYLVFIMGVITCLIGLTLSAVIGRKSKSGNALEFMFVAGVGNTGFVGIPFCLALFGQQGALYAMLFDFGHSFFNWAFAMNLLRRGVDTGGGLLQRVNNPVIAYILSISLVLLQVDVFPPLHEGAALVGGMTIPLALIFIGSVSSGYSIKAMAFQRRLVFVGLVKLILLPFLMLPLIMILPLPSPMDGVVLVQAAMPTLALAPIIFARYKKDSFFGASAVFITSLAGFYTVLLVYFTYYNLVL
ncbi:AEC family transporter [Dethiobacter alkaliphilus]|uniref:AEC family transporter n=1 Tax=Dethiobacter alkaliphilus TaxID=427926 RepID=UPI0022268FA0|nr:AEC family transporter [Dethiobacter alkaliphilus]MCW3490010.1 AEC family transporter [Dethiobacter alkaliphilus]